MKWNMRTKSALLGLLVIGARITAGESELVPEAVLSGLTAQIDQALTNSPDALQSNTRAALVAADVALAKSARLPSMGGSFSWTQGREKRQYYADGAQGAEKLGYSVSINQSVYQWNTVTLGIDNAKIRKQISEGGTRLAYLTLVKAVRYNYLNSIIALAVLERARFGEELTEARYQETVSKNQKHLASDSEVFNGGLARDAAVIDRMSAEDGLNRSLIVLARLVGNDRLTETALPREVPLPNVDRVGQIVSARLQDRLSGSDLTNTSIENSKRDIKIAQNNLAINKATLRPRLSVVAGVTRDEQSLTADPTSLYTSDYVYGGVQVSWAIFDGFASRSRVRSSLATIRSAEISLTAKERAFSEDIEQLSGSLSRTALSVKLEEKRFESAQNYLKFTQEQVKKGEASEAQLAAAKDAAMRARIAAFNVRFGYWNILSELLALTESDPVLDRLPNSHG